MLSCCLRFILIAYLDCVLGTWKKQDVLRIFGHTEKNLGNPHAHAGLVMHTRNIHPIMFKCDYF